jgi:2-haloacid dehalogenase
MPTPSGASSKDGWRSCSARDDVGVADRWATFDCYGTLIDWNAGISAELARIFGGREARRLLTRYHELEPAIQEQEPTARYRDVMAAVLARLTSEEGIELSEGEADALGRSLPGWPPFDEVAAELADARERGWRLAILSNTDRDFIDASMERIGVPFELAIVASEIGSYKPARGHWDAFVERTGADRSAHIHVAASPYHDIAPAAELGIRSIWINRLGEASDLPRARELPDLSGLGEELDALVRQ